MEKKVKLWCIMYILATMSVVNGVRTTTKSQASMSPTPAPAPVDCNDLIYDMVDCMSFLSNGQSDPKPSASCCTGFEQVLNADAECVCVGLKNAADMGLSINITKAGTLPVFCHVNAPPISSCNISTAPVPSLGPTPVNPPATTPSTPPTNNAPPTSSPSPTSPNTPPPTTTTPPTPTISPTSEPPEVAPSSQSLKSSGINTMPMFLVSSVVVVTSFCVV